MLIRTGVMAVAAVTLLLNAARGDQPASSDAPDAAAMFAQLDANKDGQLAAEEVAAEHRRLFDRLLRTADQNNDGKLSGDEFSAGLAAKPADPPRGGDDKPGRPPRDGRVFARLDGNGDGKITLDEVPEERRDGFKKLIARADKDGDGGLSREEFVQGRPDEPPKPDQPAKNKRPDGPPRGPGDGKLLARFDANGDGRVALDEVPEQARPRLEGLIRRADKDGDGAVTSAELEALRPPGQPPRERRDGPPGDRPRPGGGLLGVLDTDGDGRLSSGEISAAADALRKLDRDGDGNLAAEELGPPPPKPPAGE